MIDHGYGPSLQRTGPQTSPGEASYPSRDIIYVPRLHLKLAERTTHNWCFAI